MRNVAVRLAPKDQLAKPVATKERKGFSSKTLARMEPEMVTLERDLKAIESSYEVAVLKLTLARACVRKLLNHPAVAKYLSTHYADILAEFTALAAMESQGTKRIHKRISQRKSSTSGRSWPRLGRRVYLLLICH